MKIGKSAVDESGYVAFELKVTWMNVGENMKPLEYFIDIFGTRPGSLMIFIDPHDDGMHKYNKDD